MQQLQTPGRASESVLSEYRQAREAAAVFDLSERGLIELSGPEAAMFLHNLCTNDIKNLQGGSSCEAFLTTAKAKIIARLIVTKLEVGGQSVLWLDVAPGMAERVREHLDHHLISEQVEIKDRSAEFGHLYIGGLEAAKSLERFAVAGATLVRNDILAMAGFDLYCPRAHAEAAWLTVIASGTPPAGREAYEILRVEAGTPADGVDFDDDRMVMEMGRTKQAICYTKGCFLGQEPIVMARDRGHVNRTLLGLRIAGETAVSRGAKVLRDGQEVGQVTSSVVSPRLGSIALAYMRRGNQDLGTTVVVDDNGVSRSAAVAGLPFTEA